MTTAPESAPAQRREIRSFVRRQGRMTSAQRRALDELWSRYGLDAPAAALDLAAVFGRTAPVVLEIGFGNGEHLLGRARAEPHADFIGVEVHRPGVGALLQHAAAAQLNNLRVACEDAVVVLRDWLAPASLREIVIQFPDPWHKTRHHKRRLIQPGFAHLLARALASGGTLQLATDWEHYAAHMLAVLDEHVAFVNLAGPGGFVPRPATRPKTRFEARGERLGHAVFDLSYRRV